MNDPPSAAESSGSPGADADGPERGRILVVEDESDIAAVVAYQLAREGHQVETAADGASAKETLKRDLPDLVVLDRMLPDISGDELLRDLRSDRHARHLPVLVLTVLRQEEERIEGLELGADDYLTKPFSARELVLRVRALLRRARQGPRSGRHGVLRATGIELDAEAHRLTVDGEPVELTPTEFRLLHTLLERRGRTQSREQLLERVWEMDPTLADRIRTRTVDMHIRRLRKKLGAYGRFVITVRGFGYRLSDEDEVDSPTDGT